jgi:hypothetical protein
LQFLRYETGKRALIQRETNVRFCLARAGRKANSQILEKRCRRALLCREAKPQ